MNKTLLLTGASAFELMLGMSAPSYAVDGAKANATGTSSGNTASDLGSIRDNLTDGSWNGGATGIVHNQQNNGNNNAIKIAIMAITTSNSISVKPFFAALMMTLLNDFR